MNRQFLENLQRFTADAMISPSALRNVGAPGVMAIAQAYLAKLPLRGLSRLNGAQYQAWLDNHTETLRMSFPDSAQKWGAARKALNIFMRTAAYTLPLAAKYDLERVLPYLEVPLDKDVATALRNTSEGQELPRWVSIVSLTPEHSRLYQGAASRVAPSKRVHRADLDVYYWGV
jgi:hypothetical protein